MKNFISKFKTFNLNLKNFQLKFKTLKSQLIFKVKDSIYKISQKKSCTCVEKRKGAVSMKKKGKREKLSDFSKKKREKLAPWPLASQTLPTLTR